MYAITDEHLHMHCTGLAPAPAPKRAPAHAHSTLNTHTYRSALSQSLVVRYHERQEAICRHDKEQPHNVHIVPACPNNLRCEFKTRNFEDDYLKKRRTRPAPGKNRQTRSRRESTNEIETRITERYHLKIGRTCTPQDRDRVQTDPLTRSA